MHPALVLDAIVAKSAGLHPVLLTIVRPVLYPFIVWRMKNIARILATEYRWLPDTEWEKVEKHGQNVVYGVVEKKTTLYESGRYIAGVKAVDYKNHTVRTVFDVPEKYHKTGSVF